MKRIKAACICQTLHFMLKEDIAHELAVRQVQEEVTHYKHTLERNRTQHKILEETTQPAGAANTNTKKKTKQARGGVYQNGTGGGGDPRPPPPVFVCREPLLAVTEYTVCWCRSRWSVHCCPTPRSRPA